MSVREHLQECAKEDWRRGVRLPFNPIQPDWNAWAEWTAKFACEDEYTARSSLERWDPKDRPPSSLVGSDRARELVRKALVDARKVKTAEECPGLHSISDDEWKRFVGN